MMPEPILDEYENEHVRWLAQKYLDHEDSMTSIADFRRYGEVSKDRAYRER